MMPVSASNSLTKGRESSTLSSLFKRIVDWPCGAGLVSLNALDPEYFLGGEFGRWPLFGPRWKNVWEVVARGEAVVVSSNFALNLDVHVGDEIGLETPAGRVKLRIAGITADFASSRGTVEMSRQMYERLWRDRQLTRVLVRTAPGADIDAVRAAIARDFGRKYDLRILSSGELVEYFASQVRRAFAGLDVVRDLVLVVVFLGMADTLAAGVAERTRELGAIRALGVRRRQLRRMVLLEAASLGVLGLVLAAGAGLTLGTLWVKATFPYLLGWVLELHVPYRKIVGVGVVAVAVCLAAALLPARRAAALQPARALRYE